MPPDGVVVVAAEGQLRLGIVKSVEYFLNQQFVTQAAVDGEGGPFPEKGRYDGPLVVAG